MKIKSLHIENFMLFDALNVEWSPDVNIISGDNSTGKTTLLKALYAIAKSQEAAKAESPAAEKNAEAALAQKLLGCFRPDSMKIGRLVSRQKGGAAASLTAVTDTGASISASFTSRQDKRVTLARSNFAEGFAGAVYIPPKEMISSAGHFQSLYEEYHLDFEEMYYDLARLLSRPPKKEIGEGQRRALKRFEKILKGRIAQKDKKFYLRASGKGDLEMGLLSEGYRKLATIACLIQSGSLNAGSLLFWDEPEANMNPAMIQPLSEAIMEIAAMDVQVFIATHDYFVQQAFNMYNVYPRLKPAGTDIKFISLYSGDGGIACEIKDTVGDLEHNPIMEEFDSIYDRELKLIDDNF